MSVLVADKWIDAPAGTFNRIPAGVGHDFENRGSEVATAFNVFIPVVESQRTEQPARTA